MSNLGTKQKLAEFLHGSCGSPVSSTWTEAIDNNQFATWPGLTAELICKHLPKSIATTKGHLDQRRRNLKPTQPRKFESSPAPQSQTEESPGRRTNIFITKAFKITGQIYTDLPGRLPSKPRRGNSYILVLYNYDRNAILAEPTNRRSAVKWL